MKRRISLKTISVLLVAIMCLSVFVACGQQNANPSSTGEAQAQTSAQTQEQAQTPAPEKFKVGVIVYDNTDLQQQAVNKYFTDHIGPAFNTEFIFSDAIKDSVQEISFIENCASKGAKGIVGCYQASNKKVLYDKCKELGMYYVYADINDKDLVAAAGNDYFLGGTSTAAGDYESAYAMTMSFMEGGARKIGAATGGASFGVRMFIERQRGINEAVKDFEAKNPGTKITLDIIEGFPNDTWFASQAKMIASNPDAIIATFSGEFLWLQPLTDAGKAGKIKLGTITSLNAVSEQAMLDGKINYIGAIYPQIYGPRFALLYNAMSGYAKEFTDNGNVANISIKNIDIKSVEDMKKWVEVMKLPNPPYSADDLKKVCKAFNPAATYQDWANLAKAYSYEDVVARRAADKK